MGAKDLSPLGARADPGHVLTICRAVELVARRSPVRAMCIEMGIAAQWMLRRRGVDAYLHYGIRQEPEELKAHVWVTVEGKGVLGSREADGFALVGTFPDERQADG